MVRPQGRADGMIVAANAGAAKGKVDGDGKLAWKIDRRQIGSVRYACRPCPETRIIGNGQTGGSKAL